MNQLTRLFALSSLAAYSVFGQAVTSLSGVVTDPTGAAIPGTSIKLTNLEINTVRETSSDAEGRYSFSALAPGLYKLLGKKEGFADVSVQNLRLLVNTPATVNVAFENSFGPKTWFQRADPVAFPQSKRKSKLGSL